MRLLILSHVLPFPGTAGQQLRVRYTLKAAVRAFDVDFLTFAPPARIPEVERQLAAFGCRPIVLPRRVGESRPSKLGFAIGAAVYAAATGLKRSNYVIGHVELSPARIESAITPGDYDAVLYEYFHAVSSVPVFQNAGVPTVLDMHNVLWKSREQRLEERAILPGWLKRRSVRRYRRREESAWDRFDALIAINRNELNVVRARQQPRQKVFYAPMGTDLALWSACWHPADPPRVAYYGGLGGVHNEAAALRCHGQIMPIIWERFPHAELWIVGSNPSVRLQKLTSDQRVKVTGFVEKVQPVLATMSLVLCPWSGSYGFRSRLVEVMALGVPVVATPAAVDGMELESGRGIILGNSDGDLARSALGLLELRDALREQSQLARSEMDRLYSLESTYGRLVANLQNWLEARDQGSRTRARKPTHAP